MKKIDIPGLQLRGDYFMAPLAGYTNSAFRMMVAKCGASLTYTEMISANAIVYDNKKTMEMLPSKKEIAPVALQLFGGEEKMIFQALEKIIGHCYFDVIDLNLGCPVPKVMKQRSGSYWLKRQDELYSLFKGVVDRSPTPVFIKTRLGMDETHKNYLEVIKIAHQAGITAVALHGRTKAQFYQGSADQYAIKEAVELNLLPIIANGDINLDNIGEIKSITGAPHFMVGRFAIGNPTCFSNFLRLDRNEAVVLPTAFQQLEFMQEHLEALIEINGETNAIKDFRGLSSFYLKGLPSASKYRNALVKMNSLDDFKSLLSDFQKELI